jgi:HAD superfamily hydrolase (TIGR01549 family)
MRNFDGIIFDIDGTLTSTNELIFASFNHLAKKYLNKTFTNDEIISFFGPTEEVVIRDWCGDRYDEGVKDYYNFYTTNHHMADLYPGMKELLTLIKTNGVLLSIYTGKGERAATITLKKLGIFDYFDMIITGDNVKEHKPSAEGIIKFIDHFKLDKEKVLMIGDSVSDVKASRSAGVKIASVIWDSYAKEEVIKLKSDYIFNSVEELHKFIKENI